MITPEEIRTLRHKHPINVYIAIYQSSVFDYLNTTPITQKEKYTDMYIWQRQEIIKLLKDQLGVVELMNITGLND